MPIEQLSARHRHRIIPISGGEAEIWLEPAGASVKLQRRHATRTEGGEGGWHWRRCDSPGCLAEALVGQAKCLGHIDDHGFKSALEKAIELRHLSLQGITLTEALWRRLTKSILFEDDSPNATFNLSGAEIDTNINFRDLTSPTPVETLNIREISFYHPPVMVTGG
jgi:hypothetical protein